VRKIMVEFMYKGLIILKVIHIYSFFIVYQICIYIYIYKQILKLIDVVLYHFFFQVRPLPNFILICSTNIIILYFPYCILHLYIYKINQVRLIDFSET